MKILIVEDDDNIMLVLQEYIGVQGIACDTARCIRTAMACMEKVNYDIIFLDILLEGEFSTPLIGIARDWYSDNPPKIVIISAMAGSAKIAESYRVYKYLPKPFDLETIDEIILENKH